MTTDCPKNGCEYSGELNSVKKHFALSSDHTGTFFSESEMIESIKQTKEKLGRVPKFSDMLEHTNKTQNDFEDVFGGWSFALEEAGLSTHRRVQYDKQDVVDDLKRVAEELGRTPSQNEMDEFGKFGKSTYCRVFGAWNEIIREAGLELNQRRGIKREELLNEIEETHKELGRVPKQSDLKSNSGKFSVNVYRRVFGSWNNALREARLDVNAEYDLDNEKLLDEIHRLADELGETPRYDDMSSRGRYSSTLYERRFGSWNNALREAELEPRKVFKIDEDKLLPEIKRLKDELGRTPTQFDLEKHGEFGVDPYKRVFGTWNNALSEAGFDPVKRGMKGTEQSLYVIDCGSGKYYVGVSNHPDKRLRQHKYQGRSSANWIKEHGVKERIYLGEPMPHDEAYRAEREKTLELMEKHGWKNVRGAQWLSIDLESPPKQLSTDSTNE